MNIKYPPRRTWRTHRKDCYCNTCFNHKCVKNKDKPKAPTDYFEYIQSSHWHDRKRRYYKTHKKQCKACGNINNIDLHHILYGDFGNEANSSLVPLCKHCHTQLHKQYRTSGDMRQVTQDFIKQKQNDIKTLIKIMST